jgi:exopolyphosphatase/guanosine-5'-triphosphate,3'-diphosphate pyrophosphatase
VWGEELPILHAETEAALATLGARAGTGLEPPLVCVDLGGGSTELVALRGRVRGQRSPRLDIRSFDVGCLVLAERYLGTSPFSKGVTLLSRALMEAVTPVVPLGEEPGPWIAVGGTVTALATMNLGLSAHDPDRVHAHRLTREAIARLAERLIESSRDAGSAFAGFHRQPSLGLLAGALLLGHLLSIHAVPGITSSSWGLRHGLVLARALSGRRGTSRRSQRDPRRSPAVARHWATAKLPDLRLSGDSPNP